MIYTHALLEVGELQTLAAVRQQIQFVRNRLAELEYMDRTPELQDEFTHLHQRWSELSRRYGRLENNGVTE